MVAIHVDEETFEQEVMLSDKPVLIDFYSDFCSPCRMMAPVFEELSDEYKGKMKFVKVDTLKSTILSQGFHIESIPTFSVVHKGQELERWIGLASKDALKKRIDEVLVKAKLLTSFVSGHQGYR
ncbi:MAG: thioredoxin [Nanoarchaeota archaeon]|nr:thioredoxin [Nanoarchaeota archaeon]